MKKEDYVSLEVAKPLKEKGYDEYCGAYYHLNWEDMTEGECFEVAPNHDFRNKDNGYRTGAPTLYEAAKWFRENHNIHIDVKCTAYCKPLNRCDYICEIFALSSHQFIDTEIYHKYEEALNAGILEALKLI